MNKVLQRLDDGLWIADMAVARGGMELGARMTAVRIPDGALWIHSPIALTPELKRQLDAAGTVAHVVAPSRFHYEHLAEFSRTYPAARMYATAAYSKPPPGARIDARLGEKPEAAWAGVLDQAPFHGSSLYDEVDFFHAASRTLILTDLLFNIPETRSASTRFWSRVLGVLGKPSASRIFALTARDRSAVRASLERILAWDFDRILLTHGDIVPAGGKAAFRSAFARYLG